VGFKVLTVVTTGIAVLWNVTLGSLVDVHWYFRGKSIKIYHSIRRCISQNSYLRY
jgi:uncharacterized membrane protein